MDPIYDPVRARIEELQRTAVTVHRERDRRDHGSAATPIQPATAATAALPQPIQRIEPDLRSGTCPQPTSTAAAR